MKQPRIGINSRAGQRDWSQGQPRQRFMVGKYEIRSEPLPGSIHMRRYTVFSMGLRIGTMVSLPTESDCLYLENPPSVPPLKPYFFHRPGRPKKGVAPPSIIAAVFEAG